MHQETSGAMCNERAGAVAGRGTELEHAWVPLAKTLSRGFLQGLLESVDEQSVELVCIMLHMAVRVGPLETFCSQVLGFQSLCIHLAHESEELLQF